MRITTPSSSQLEASWSVSDASIESVDGHQWLATPPAIDVHKLKEQCLDNLAFAVQLLDEFQKDASERVDAIALEIAQDDVDAVEKMAHGLKGVAGMLAMPTLAKFFAELESAASGDELEHLKSIVPDLRDELQRALDQIPAIRAMAQLQK